MSAGKFHTMPMFRLIAPLMFLSCCPAFAEPTFNVSGFGTLGIVVTDSEQFGYRSDFSSTGAVFDGKVDLAESSNLGVHFETVFSPSFDAVVQAVYRNQDDPTLDSLLNMAFVRYTPDSNWSFRAGRVAFDLFLLTEYRDIGFAYPWAHVPNEIYSVIPHRNIDGADATYTRSLVSGSISGKLYYGQSEASLSGFGESILNPVKFGEVVGIALDYQTPGWDISLNHSQVTFDSQLVTPIANGIKQLNTQVPGFNHIWPNAGSIAAGIEIDNTKGTYTSVGGQYSLQAVTLIGELARIKADSLSVQDVDSGYISATYHVGLHNFFTSYAFSRTGQLADDEVNLQVLAQIPGGLLAYNGAQTVLGFYSVNQKTASLGWRWDFTEKMSFKLQWDHTRINNGGSTFWQPPRAFGNLNKPTGRVNTLFSNVSFAF